MYQENELKKLYERLKAQYPQYQLEFSGDSLTLNRLYCKVEVNQSGVKIYANGNLYDQFTSEYVDDLDDLYELIEAFLLDLQHAGMKQGNETYIFATKQAAKMGSRFLIGIAMCFTILMIGLITANSPWLFLLIFLLPAASLLMLKQMQKKIFQRCPWAGKVIVVRWRMCPNVLTAPMCWNSHRNWRRSRRNMLPKSLWNRPMTCQPPAASGHV